jgi:SAM-dependent methyltransferase
MASLAASAFDREAPGYDHGFGRNPVGLLFRYVFQERLRARLAPGSRVLDIGCGTGEDALFLAGQGRSVHAIDVAPGMLERARTKAKERGVGEERVRFERRAAEDVAGAGSDFDGAYSGFGALNCADLPAVAGGLAAALRPGALVLLSLMTRRPLPALLEQALTGRGELPRGLGQPLVGGTPLPVSYPGLREVKRRFGPSFAWTGAFALGVLIPGPGHAGWASRHPQCFGLLAAIEGLVRRWPILRTLGDHVVIEGARR